MSGSLAAKRAQTRDKLDRQSDFVVVGGKITFRQTFVPVEAGETFCMCPQDVIEAGRRLLALDISSGVSRAVHNNVVVKIGSNTIPLFALVDGGRGRSLHTFRCVYTGCAAFMDIRVLLHADVIKWVVMGVSHNHHFEMFPRRLPRNTLGADVRAAVHAMVLQNRPCAEIRRQNGILCNKDVLQNAMRSARKETLRANCPRGFVMFLFELTCRRPSKCLPKINWTVVCLFCSKGGERRKRRSNVPKNSQGVSRNDPEISRTGNWEVAGRNSEEGMRQK